MFIQIEKLITLIIIATWMQKIERNSFDKESLVFKKKYMLLNTQEVGSGV